MINTKNHAYIYIVWDCVSIYKAGILCIILYAFFAWLTEYNDKCAIMQCAHVFMLYHVGNHDTASIV